jgi:transcriptional regulator with XRE-family HTH domain
LSDESELTPEEVFAMRVREARKRRGWTQKQLADRLTEIGYPTERTTVVKIEAGGRRSNAPISDVFAFAVAFGVSPVHLLVPLDDEAEVRIVGVAEPMKAPAARAWIRGRLLLPDADTVAYLSEFPVSARRALIDRALTSSEPGSYVLGNWPAWTEPETYDAVHRQIDRIFEGRARGDPELIEDATEELRKLIDDPSPSELEEGR